MIAIMRQRGKFMAFLKLQDIGKIYMSADNASVGIRKVNLSFEKGEFVAVTGKSGSGKTTLLNVRRVCRRNGKVGQR